jgi:hypothetical protein
MDIRKSESSCSWIEKSGGAKCRFIVNPAVKMLKDEGNES